MKLCAIVIGTFENQARTVASLKNFTHLEIIYTAKIAEVSFHSLNSDYVFFIKNGDALAPYAHQLLELNLEFKHPDILYSDEQIEYRSREHMSEYHKPDYSPDMILSMNYFGNLLCVRTELLKNIRSIESKTYQNFLYEIVLSILPCIKKIFHVREMLYISHRKDKKDVYQDFFDEFDQEAGKRLLEKYCKNNRISADVVNGRYPATYRVKYALQTHPLVSIIIPFRDQPKLLKTCLNSILNKSTYKNIEIIGIDNGSIKEETLKLMQEFKNTDSRIEFYTLNIPFNYSVLNNHAAFNIAKGEHLVFLNNDTEVISPDWIEAMLEHSQRSNVGVVGVKLLFPDDTIQHCGVIFQTHPQHIHRLLADDEPGYFYAPHVVRNYHMLTFACVMVKAKIFNAVGGLNELLAVDYNDIDFCARVSTAGYHNIYTPYAVLYHYESKTRGQNNTVEKQIRWAWELSVTIETSPSIFLQDSLSSYAHIDSSLQEMIAMQKTLSWRITRPLRELKKLKRNLNHKIRRFFKTRG